MHGRTVRDLQGNHPQRERTIDISPLEANGELQSIGAEILPGTKMREAVLEHWQKRDAKYAALPDLLGDGLQEANNKWRDEWLGKIRPEFAAHHEGFGPRVAMINYLGAALNRDEQRPDGPRLLPQPGRQPVARRTVPLAASLGSTRARPTRRPPTTRRPRTSASRSRARCSRNAADLLRWGPPRGTQMIEPHRCRRAALLLIAAAVVSQGCAISNKMSGVSEAHAIQKIGEPARATVIEVWDTGITVNNDPVIGLRLTVDERPGHPPYEAVIKKSRVSRVHMPQFQPGSHVPIRIDPNDPARVALDVYK